MQLRDAAEMLGVHYQTAYAWVRQGVLPARKTGRGYQVSESDVTALAVVPSGRPSPTAVITVTPVAKWPMTSLNSSEVSLR